MTQLLEEAIEKVRELPEAAQNLIASLILEEIDDEQRWDEAFANSQDKLAELAAKVRADLKVGRIRDGGFGDL